MTLDEITCHELVDLVTEYFEGVLDDPTAERIEEHLVMCAGCQVYVDQMRLTISISRSMRADETGPGPSEAVLEALRVRRNETER